jgi:hypothetical protein
MASVQGLGEARCDKSCPARPYDAGWMALSREGNSRLVDHLTICPRITFGNRNVPVTPPPAPAPEIPAREAIDRELEEADPAGTDVEYCENSGRPRPCS